MRVPAEINSIIDILSMLAMRPYLQLVLKGVITNAEAAEELRADADLLEKMNLRAPFVGFAVAKQVREYAEAFDRVAKGEAGPPSLTLLRGGLEDDAP